jgi:hypothetical protein
MCRCNHEHNTVLVHYKSKQKNCRHIEWAGLKLITLYVHFSHRVWQLQLYVTHRASLCPVNK